MFFFARRANFDTYNLVFITYDDSITMRFNHKNVVFNSTMFLETLSLFIWYIQL